MSEPDPLISSLKAAVAAAPGDVPLRVHLAGLLAEAGDEAGAVRHAAAALHAAPEDAEARALMARLLGGGHTESAPPRRAVPYAGPGVRPPAGLGRPTPRPHLTDPRHPAEEPAHPTFGAPGDAGGRPSSPGLWPGRESAAGQAPGAAPAPATEGAGRTAAGGPGSAQTHDDGVAGSPQSPAAATGSARTSAGNAPGGENGPGARPAGRPEAPDPHAPFEPEGGWEPFVAAATAPPDPATGWTPLVSVASPDPAHPDPAPPRPADDAGERPGDTPRTRRERREALERQATAAAEAARADHLGRLLARAAQVSSGRGDAPTHPRADLPGTAFVPATDAGPLGAAPTFTSVPTEPGAARAGAFAPLVPHAPSAEPVTLADVAGMEFAKEGLAATIIEPLRHPEVRGLYQRGLRGGVLLYGPPGAGKSFLADAIAGELHAAFLPVDIGRHLAAGGPAALRAALHLARSIQPVLVCLDDIELLGPAGGPVGIEAAQVVEDFLAGIEEARDGVSRVSVVATTTAPWDVPPQLRRSGRFEKSMLVTTPDQAARDGLLRRFLTEAGAAPGLATAAALRTEGFCAVDLGRLVELAVRRRADRDGLDPARAAAALEPDDLEAVRRDIHPEAEQWLARAGRIATAAGGDPLYAGLVAYLSGRRPAAR